MVELPCSVETRLLRLAGFSLGQTGRVFDERVFLLRRVRVVVNCTDMSVNEAMIVLRDEREYTPEVAEFIAMEVAKGSSVQDLHEAFDDQVPNPIIVNRWRRQVPAFNLLMQEAEEAYAQLMAHETIGISDDGERMPAAAGNAIKARQWYAGKLSERFSSVPKRDDDQGLDASKPLTLEQLMRIAQGGKAVIEGKCESVEGGEEAGDGKRNIDDQQEG